MTYRNPKTVRRLGLEPDDETHEPTETTAAHPTCEPDWNTPCEVCGAVPTVAGIGMCGPCTFGEAETAGGNW